MRTTEQYSDCVVLAPHVDHLTRLERWRTVLCEALESVAEGFEANGHEYDKTGASDTGRQSRDDSEMKRCDTEMGRWRDSN